MFYLVLSLVLASCAASSSPNTAAGKCSNSKVEITWLGVTMYFVRYWYQGREVKLLLDDQIAKDYTDKAFNEALGANGKLDYIFIGHMHFDHDGRCPQKIFGEPSYFKCSAFQDQAANYSAKVVAPQYGCDSTHPGTNCTTVYPSPSAPQVFALPDIGLRVTAIPQAHSYLELIPGHGARGAPGCNGGITGLECPDPFAYLLEFPGEAESEQECASSFFWADTAHNHKPFLGYSEKGDPSLPLLNYSQLLKQAFSKLPGDVRTTLMAFPSYFMPNEQSWQEWAQVVRPLYHTNHHHGESSDDYWPDLPSRLLGPAIGSDSATWISTASVPGGVPTASSGMTSYTPTFLALDDFFVTLRMQGPSLVENVDLGYAAKFRSSLHAREESQFIV